MTLDDNEPHYPPPPISWLPALDIDEGWLISRWDRFNSLQFANKVLLSRDKSANPSSIDALTGLSYNPIDSRLAEARRIMDMYARETINELFRPAPESKRIAVDNLMYEVLDYLSMFFGEVLTEEEDDDGWKKRIDKLIMPPPSFHCRAPVDAKSPLFPPPDDGSATSSSTEK
ncbi:hypothetical protein XA68_17081 [Ophiocordyceps unilateralis]|uniref:Uncharacterized protein n=1 Tax=Ophiocordyceps unilateralis TaxID=268505 RepID=A0A2A9P5H3_OPHUN|nr:hypothetical protein XA68_17081 [Ophiocordyceps unilateralis]